MVRQTVQAGAGEDSSTFLFLLSGGAPVRLAVLLSCLVSLERVLLTKQTVQGGGRDRQEAEADPSTFLSSSAVPSSPLSSSAACSAGRSLFRQEQSRLQYIPLPPLLVALFGHPEEGNWPGRLCRQAGSGEDSSTFLSSPPSRSTACSAVRADSGTFLSPRCLLLCLVTQKRVTGQVDCAGRQDQGKTPVPSSPPSRSTACSAVRKLELDVQAEAEADSSTLLSTQ